MAQGVHEHDLYETYQDFLEANYWDEIGKLLQEYPDDQKSLHIDFMDLFRYSAGEFNLSDEYLQAPEQQEQLMVEALDDMTLPVDLDLSGVEIRVHAPTNESLTYSIDQIRADHSSEFLAVTGQVHRVTSSKPRIQEAVFECQRCGTLNRTPVITDFREPYECEGCERQGPFQVNSQKSEFVDFQQIRLQQPPEEVRGGEGESIDVEVQGDLVDEINPGDRVDVSGVIRMKQESNDSPLFPQYVEGRAVDVRETDFEDIDIEEHRDRIEALSAGEEGDPYELLIKSLAPKIRSMPEVKLALILQLFGGVPFNYPEGSKGRGDSHILMLGDPGTAKSSLLQAVAELSPRSAMASGKGATKAGITAGAVSDDFGDQEWSLEAGALVRAHKGVACIDELDKVEDSVVSAMHTPMEQQQVSVSKIVKATLPCQTAVLAAGNPKYGRFEPSTPLADQIELDGAMLSRFDLIFMLKDTPDEDADSRKIDHVLEARELGIRYDRRGERMDEDELQKINPAIDPEVLRAYIAYAKQECFPTFENDEVKEYCKDEFMKLRLANADEENGPVPVTLRKLQAFRRLSEASARVRLSDDITMDDIERAKQLISRCMEDVGVDPESGEFDVDIVESGTSKTQRDRIKNIEGIIKELEQENEDGAPYDEVLERAGTVGISESKAEHEIEKLKNCGDLYEPNTDHLRTTDNLS